jgi:hypothetical protein
VAITRIMLPSSAAGTTAATTAIRCHAPRCVKRASSTPTGIRLKSDVIPLHASATNSASPPGSRITLPSRSTVTPNTCSTPTAPALAKICSWVTIGNTIASGSGTMNNRKPSGNASRRSPREPQRYPTSAAIAPTSASPWSPASAATRPSA